VNAASTRYRPTTLLDISQMNTAQLYPQKPKHLKWLKNTINTFYNLRLAVPSFASREFLHKLTCNNRISIIFSTEHLSVGLRCFTQGRLLTKANKTHDNWLPYFCLRSNGLARIYWRPTFPLRACLVCADWNAVWAQIPKVGLASDWKHVFSLSCECLCSAQQNESAARGF